MVGVAVIDFVVAVAVAIVTPILSFKSPNYGHVPMFPSLGRNSFIESTNGGAMSADVSRYILRHFTCNTPEQGK